MRELGLTTGFELHDGSGLSRSNRLSPRAVVRILAAMADDFTIGPEFLASLKVAGAEGSRRRFQDPLCFRRMRIKTGHLYGTTALAGFAQTASGRRLVFSIMANGYRRGRQSADRSLERFCEEFLDDAQALTGQVESEGREAVAEVGRTGRRTADGSGAADQ